MKIALDYDRTYTIDRDFWDLFISLARQYKHDVRIVTARSPHCDQIQKKKFSWWKQIPIIYCDGVAKRFHCHWFADWNPDVWIDDKPEGIDQNSKATKEILETWRQSDEYNN